MATTAQQRGGTSTAIVIAGWCSLAAAGVAVLMGVMWALPAVGADVELPDPMRPVAGGVLAGLISAAILAMVLDVVDQRQRAELPVVIRDAYAVERDYTLNMMASRVAQETAPLVRQFARLREGQREIAAGQETLAVNLEALRIEIAHLAEEGRERDAHLLARVLSAVEDARREAAEARAQVDQLIIKPLIREIVKQRSAVGDLRSEVADLRAEVKALAAQPTEIGMDPESIDAARRIAQRIMRAEGWQ